MAASKGVERKGALESNFVKGIQHFEGDKSCNQKMVDTDSGRQCWGGDEYVGINVVVWRIPLWGDLLIKIRRFRNDVEGKFNALQFIKFINT